MDARDGVSDVFGRIGKMGFLYHFRGHEPLAALSSPWIVRTCEALRWHFHASSAERLNFERLGKAGAHMTLLNATTYLQQDVDKFRSTWINDFSLQTRLKARAWLRRTQGMHPYLPRATVATTSARAYLSLLAGGAAS